MAILTTDFDASAAYLSVRTTTPVDRTITTTVNVDLDEHGEIVGIEFLTWPLEHVYAVGDWARVVFPSEPDWHGQVCQVVLTAGDGGVSYGYRVRREDGVYGRLYSREMEPTTEPKRGICHVCAGAMYFGEERWVHNNVHAASYHAATPTRLEPQINTYWWLNDQMYQAGAATSDPTLYRVTRGKPFHCVKWEDAHGATQVEMPGEAYVATRADEERRQALERGERA